MNRDSVTPPPAAPPLPNTFPHAISSVAAAVISANAAAASIRIRRLPRVPPSSAIAASLSMEALRKLHDLL